MKPNMGTIDRVVRVLVAVVIAVLYFTEQITGTAAIILGALAAYPDFLPFWEFVSGPLHAGSYGPFGADATFGVQVRYSRASPVRGASPAAGFQFFGEVAIDPDSGCLTVQLCDVSGSVLHTEVIAPHPPCV